MPSRVVASSASAPLLYLPRIKTPFVIYFAVLPHRLRVSHCKYRLQFCFRNTQLNIESQTLRTFSSTKHVPIVFEVQGSCCSCWCLYYTVLVNVGSADRSAGPWVEQTQVARSLSDMTCRLGPTRRRTLRVTVALLALFSLFYYGAVFLKCKFTSSHFLTMQWCIFRS